MTATTERRFRSRDRSSIPPGLFPAKNFTARISASLPMARNTTSQSIIGALPSGRASQILTTI
jgi:hypothetical protein